MAKNESKIGDLRFQMQFVLEHNVMGISMNPLPGSTEGQRYYEDA
jgi:hypothetical protein